eukprot:tig00000093_g3674.t1
MWAPLAIVGASIALALFLFVLNSLYLIGRRRALYGKRTVVGIFHPYSNDGGGGERVLWCCIRALQSLGPDIHCVLYTGEGVSAEETLRTAQARFNVSLERPIDFVFLKRRHWVEAKRYPFLTMLGQSLGSVLLGWEALSSLVPHVYFDTMGYAFTYPLAKAFGLFTTRVACYVHYPTISTDMLAMVAERRPTYNNDARIAASAAFSASKRVYYRAFAAAYGLCGAFGDLVLVNSSWTRGHIDALWRRPGRTHVVFPPCNTRALCALPLERPPSRTIVSVAQFRPEKDHELQLRSFARLLASGCDARLALVGGVRSEEDAARVERLRALAAKLGVQDKVEWHVSVPHGELVRLLGSARVGLHAMWNEHFGIGVVEYMAAGLVAVAHDSGGPKADIVVPHGGQATGFLASTEEGYAEALGRALELPAGERAALQAAARASVDRFSEEAFDASLAPLLAPLLGLKPRRD